MAPAVTPMTLGHCGRRFPVGAVGRRFTIKQGTASVCGDVGEWAGCARAPRRRRRPRTATSAHACGCHSPARLGPKGTPRPPPLQRRLQRQGHTASPRAARAQDWGRSGPGGRPGRGGPGVRRCCAARQQHLLSIVVAWQGFGPAGPPGGCRQRTLGAPGQAVAADAPRCSPNAGAAAGALRSRCRRAAQPN